MAASSLRWGRIALGGFLAELLLIVAVIPAGLAGAGDTSIAVIAVAGSFLVVVPIAWWLGRSLARPIAHGVLMGAVAAGIYMAISGLASLFVPDAPEVPPIYYLAHALKLAGGATGGWLAQRASAAASARVG